MRPFQLILVAVWLVACSRTDDHLEVLHDRSSSLELRLEAVRELHQDRDPAAIGPLIRVLQDVRGEYSFAQDTVRSAIIECLGSWGSPAIDSVIEVLQTVDPIDGPILSPVIELLAVTNDVRAASALVSFFRDARRSDRYRQEVEDALARLGCIAVPSIREALADSGTHMRPVLIRSLGKMRDICTVPTLMVTFRKKYEYEITESVHSALAETGGPVVDSMIAFLSDSTGQKRDAAARVLGLTKDARAVPPLISVFKISPSSGDIRRALKNMGPPAVGQLIQILAEGDRTLISSVIDILVDIRDDRVDSLFLAAWESDNLEQIEAGRQYYVSRRGEMASRFPNFYPKLIDVMWKTGSSKMAGSFLNCGDVKLRNAAEDWARENGYTITTIFLPR